ncbi:MAG: toxin-antitoxin system HicB family antitoxin [Candidatus Nephthysia bennettiae]|uniref:Type II toxin-antitoxin system HicB family antitoxin n=1 Tax=Candidatus Nephthysia bennettiae TaxID=3127016 RepID=A0A934N8J0_9BACT|nr:type II toxin-antitoxin system HicB family antitoxin [Candidatus Dormibacteraeota bacterium]PZR88230.1 MAG: toxin-antitoxin system HicB family antitoxin [Candidatus Dormibacteraeota bacterium]
MTKTVEEYLTLPYTFIVVPDESEEGQSGWVAEVEELPGCVSQGVTAGEAVEHLRDAMKGWFSVALEDEVEIPEPRGFDDFSGRILLRVPTTLHAELVREADREGISLNQFVSGALAGAVGWRQKRPRSTGAGRRRKPSQRTSVEG